jgi:two-component system CheB/CheR fusion protein
MWGLTPEEVEDQHLLSLDMGLPIEKFRPQVRSVLSGASDREEVVLEATNRRGRPFQCRVTMLPFGSESDDGGLGMIMMMESADG